MLNVRNVLWSAGQALISIMVSLVTILVVARLIGVEEVGFGAAVTSLFLLCQVFIIATVQDSVTRSREATVDELSSLFWLSIGMGVVAAVILTGAGWIYAQAMGAPKITTMCLGVAWALLLVGPAAVMNGMLNRDGNFRGLATASLVAQVLSTLAAISVAAVGGGAWALPIQQAGAVVLGLPYLIWVSRPRILRPRSRPGLRLLRSGLPLGLTALMANSRYRLFVLVIGAGAGPVALAQVHIAFRIVDAASDMLHGTFYRLLLPELSRQTGSAAAMFRSYRRLGHFIVLLTSPAMAGLFVCLPWLIVLIDHDWAPAIPAAQALALLAILRLSIFPSNTVVVAAGRGSVLVPLDLLCLLGVIVLPLLLRPQEAFAAVQIWVGLHLATLPIVPLLARRDLGVGIGAVVRPLLPGVCAALVALAAATVLPVGALPLPPPIADGGVVAAVYVACGLLFFRKSLADGLALVLRPRAAS